MSTQDYKITDAPITAWLGGQKVHIIPVFGDADKQYYDYCDICGAQPYGVEKCNGKLHRIKAIQDEIFQLRHQHTNLAKRADKILDQQKETTKKQIEKQIEQLQLDIKSL
jgi:small-conductance mechanosensitive channel